MKYSIEDVWKIRKVPPPLVAEPLKVKAAELGVDVYDLTPEQVEEAMKAAKVSPVSEPVEAKRSRKATK